MTTATFILSLFLSLAYLLHLSKLLTSCFPLRENGKRKKMQMTDGIQATSATCNDMTSRAALRFLLLPSLLQHFLLCLLIDIDYLNCRSRKKRILSIFSLSLSFSSMLRDNTTTNQPSHHQKLHTQPE